MSWSTEQIPGVSEFRAGSMARLFQLRRKMTGSLLLARVPRRGACIRGPHIPPVQCFCFHNKLRYIF